MRGSASLIASDCFNFGRVVSLMIAVPDMLVGSPATTIESGEQVGKRRFHFASGEPTGEGTHRGRIL